MGSPSPRLPLSVRSLLTESPALSKELYHERNGGLTANQIAPCSGKKLWWRCLVAGHAWEEKVSTRVSMKTGCPYCSGKRFSEEKSIAVMAPHLLPEWDDSISPLTISYGNCKIKIKWKCLPFGHRWQTTAHDRFSGKGCPYCTGRYLTPERSLTLESALVSEWGKRNVTQPSDYFRASDKVVFWDCRFCHREWSASIHDRFTKGSGCPYCASSHNKLEKFTEALLDRPKYDKCPLLQSETRYRPDIKLTDRLFLNADGLYWHSEDKKTIRHHFQLREAFETEGMRILQFYEDEIYNKSMIVKSIVDNLLGQTKNRIGARECEIAAIDIQAATAFLLANHLIGPTKTSKFIGLEYNGELVSLLAYQDRKTHIDITRFASLLGTVIAGGFQKLLKNLEDLFPNKTIRTLVDLRYADGHSLIKSGFVHKTTRIQYQYASDKERKDKRQFRVPAGVNEREAALAKGWYRIYDAGKAVYEKYPKSKITT